MPDEEWITRAEAAARAGVHRNTIVAWEREGRLRTKRASGPTGEQVMVHVADLDRVIAGRPERPVSSDGRVAALEAEIAALRERLEEVTAERDRLMSEILAIARGRRGG